MFGSVPVTLSGEAVVMTVVAVSFSCKVVALSGFDVVDGAVVILVFVTFDVIVVVVTTGVIVEGTFVPFEVALPGFDVANCDTCMFCYIILCTCCCGDTRVC